MNWIKYSLRTTLILFTVLFLIYLKVKTVANIRQIVDFKFETLPQIEADSLNGQVQFEHLETAADQFSGRILDDSLHVQEGVYYMLWLVGLLVLTESGYLLAGRIRNRKKASKI